MPKTKTLELQSDALRRVFNPLELPKSCALREWEYLHGAEELEDDYDFTSRNPDRRVHKSRGIRYEPNQ